LNSDIKSVMVNKKEYKDLEGSVSYTLIILVFFATIGGFLFGYDTGVVSGVTIFWDDDHTLSLSVVQTEQLVSVTVGAAAIGTAISGMPLQWYGRKPLILVASVMYVLGSGILAVANGFGMLFFGRFLLGLGVGLSSIAVPVYLAEMSPPHLRGGIVACYTVSIVAGQAIASLLNIGVDIWFSDSMKWRVSLGFAALPAAIQFFGFVFGLPESPKWLASMDRKKEALVILKTLRYNPTEEQIASDLEKLEAMPVEDVGEIGALLREIRRTPRLRRTFKVGMGLQLLQQFSGINTLMYYGAPILVMCGFPKTQSLELAFLLALAQGIGILFSTQLFDKYGRRALMIPSSFTSGFCLCLVSLAFLNGVEKNQFLALAGLFGYLLFFGFGLSPGPWVLNSEIYPVHMRGLGNSAATTLNWVANYIISSSFLTLVHVMGRPAVFLCLGIVGFLGAIWLYYDLPETANKTLEEIGELFDHPNDKASPYPSISDQHQHDHQQHHHHSSSSSSSSSIHHHNSMDHGLMVSNDYHIEGDIDNPLIDDEIGSTHVGGNHIE